MSYNDDEELKMGDIDIEEDAPEIDLGEDLDIVPDDDLLLEDELGEDDDDDEELAGLDGSEY